MKSRVVATMVSHMVLATLVSGCGPVPPPPGATEPATAVATGRPPSAVNGISTFPIAAFATLRDEPVSEGRAAAFRTILTEGAGGAGMTATLLTAGGMWTGATGMADGSRPMLPDDQFAIGSLTKPVIAAQVLRMAETGELGLDDLAANRLPADLAFDANGATIRQLLGMRSGIPDYVDALWDSLSADRQHRWTAREVLALVARDRVRAGTTYEDSSTNYMLLGLIIEEARRRPLATVLRGGALGGDGLERIVYQPDEAPSEPMAMPAAESTAALEDGGGYLPSLAGVTAAGPAGAIAADSASLARWWRALCAGEVVSPASLAEMTTFRDGYGLGLSDDTETFRASAVGHGGVQAGYAAYAGCLPDDGSVVVVLANREMAEVSGIARALAAAARLR